MTETPARYQARPADAELEQDATAYFREALTRTQDIGKPEILLAALGVIVRARDNHAELAAKTGIPVETLRKILTADGDPSFKDLLKVMRAMGFRLEGTRTEGSPPGVAQH